LTAITINRELLFRIVFNPEAGNETEGGMRKGFHIAVFLIAALIYHVDRVAADTILQNAGIASSTTPVGSGARALGMGGAFIAIADDATAASWNPAGLIQLERPEMSIVGDYVSRREQFSSDSNPEIGNSSTSDDLNLNFISATYPFNLLKRNMVLSVNYQRLYDFKRNFSYQFQETFTDPSGVAPPIKIKDQVRFDQDGYLGAFGLAYAIQITPVFSVGTTVNFWFEGLGVDNGWSEKLTLRSEISIGDGPAEEETIRIDDTYSDFNGVNANFGILWEVTPNIRLGAVLKTPFTGTLDHKYRESREPGKDVSLKENVDLRFPLSYGAGIAYKFSEGFIIDLDLYRTDWGDYYIKDSQGNKFSPIDGRPKNESNVKDTTQIRLGGEYLFTFPKGKIAVPLRAGIFYDPEPGENRVKDFYGFSLGSGISYKGWIFDAAYQLRWANNEDASNLIGTGNRDAHFDVRQHSFLASMIYHF
jgi:long-subunit fatty acid transport protein